MSFNKTKETKFKPKIKLNHSTAIIVPFIYRKRTGLSDVFFIPIHDSSS